MNKELLLRVKAHILEEPRRIWMGVFIKDANLPMSSRWEGKGDENCYGNREYKLPKKSQPPCGTVGCIAGWTHILHFGPNEIFDAFKVQEALGIDGSAAMELFYVHEWTPEEQLAYKNCKTAKQRALVVANKIDSFIKQYDNPKRS